MIDLYDQLRMTAEQKNRLNISPENRDKPWTEANDRLLKTAFGNGALMPALCEHLGRSSSAITARLVELRLIADQGWRHGDQVRYIRRRTQSAESLKAFITPVPQEKTTMAQELKIETKIFINGVDAKGLNDTALFTLIADEVKAIDALEALPVRSTKLTAHIAARRNQVDEVTKYLDDR